MLRQQISEPETVQGYSAEGEEFEVTGRVKGFDATRGFGFLVSDDVEGDILIHFFRVITKSDY